MNTLSAYEQRGGRLVRRSFAVGIVLTTWQAPSGGAHKREEFV